jgi:hypothetical protein
MLSYRAQIHSHIILVLSLENTKGGWILPQHTKVGQISPQNIKDRLEKHKFGKIAPKIENGMENTRFGKTTLEKNPQTTEMSLKKTRNSTGAAILWFFVVLCCFFCGFVA